ncbi:MAG: ATP-binding cassette domain-containing protein [Candidatus Hydrothermarchaeota archaeon]
MKEGGQLLEKNTKTEEELQKPILEVKGITKRFGGIVALEKVDLKLHPNEVLALLGDNGAGKTTLIKVICGAYYPNEGKIFVEGKEGKITNPEEAANLGIETIYQDLALFDVLDIPTNLFMGREIERSLRILDKKKMKKKSWDILKKLKIEIKSINQRVENLSGGQRHAVAIGRAIYVGNVPKIILMDEPTAGLGAKESDKLLDLIKELREKGISVILISHNLQHVFAVADRAVVLRSGKVVGEKKIVETSTAELIQMMIG